MAKTTHSPTRAMQSAAKRGLKSIKDGEIDQTKVPDISVKGGRKIAAGQAISDDHVRSMANYHAGHAGACPTDGEEGADDMLWGGPAGASWSASRVAAMDATSLAEQDVDLEQLLADDQDVVLEVYSRGDLLDKVDLAKDEEGYIWAPILRSGTLAMRPGPNGEKLPEPLRFVPGHSADPRKEIGLQDIVDAFDDGAVQHVTIPTTHADDVLSNTGYIEKMRISDSTLRPGEKVIMAAHRFTEPDVEGKIERGSIANRSCGILYDYVNQETGRKYPAVVAHTALTNRPWVTGMESYGTLSEDSSGDRTVVPMLLSERRVVAPPTQRDKREVIYTLDPRESLERELKLADVQWGDEPSLSSIKSQLYDLFSDMGRSPDYEESSVGFYVMDVTASKALVQVDYRGDDPDDAWVVPFSLDDDGKLTLADFAQWTPVEQQWVTDDDADQDKSEVQALLQQEGDVNLSEEQLNLKALTSKARNKLPASAFVFPDEKAYPIHDLAHARNALARGAQHESGARLAKIRAAVYRKYPQLKPDDGKSKKSNMANESTGGPMSLNLEAALNGLNLSEEARAFLQKLAEENQQLRTNLTEVQSTARKEQVAMRVKELQGLGFPPGFCKEYEQIALADDGQVAATLNLSEGGTTKEVAQTSTQLAERLLTTLLSDDQTKLALNTSGSLLSSPINGRSGLTPDDQDKIDGKKPLSAEELLAEWRKAAPEAVDQLNLATKE